MVVSDYTGFLELFDGAEWRETGRSKDALTAATTSYLVPVLREHGFKKYGKRSFGRLLIRPSYVEDSGSIADGVFLEEADDAFGIVLQSS